MQLTEFKESKCGIVNCSWSGYRYVVRTNDMHILSFWWQHSFSHEFFILFHAKFPKWMSTYFSFSNWANPSFLWFLSLSLLSRNWKCKSIFLTQTLYAFFLKADCRKHKKNQNDVQLQTFDKKYNAYCWQTL